MRGIIQLVPKTFNKFITGELCNYAIGIAFSPQYENKNTDLSQYVGFFTSHTNSFFEPYVETTYDETIEDDRADFYLDKPNKLYFYSIVGGKFSNLDEFPTCTVDNVPYDVKQATKGVYYIDIDLSSSEYEDNTMLYDIWGNIKYNGKTFPDAELEFVTKLPTNYYQFGIPSPKQETEVIPTLYGIKYKETIKRGDMYYADLSPVIGSEQGGVRPVLIIQNDVGNKFSPTVIAAAITSQTSKNKLPTHINIDSKEYGLMKNSVILAEQIRTIDKSRLKEKIGQVDETIMGQVNNALGISFGLQG